MTYPLEKTPVVRVEFTRTAAYVRRMHIHRIVGEYASHEHVCNMTNMYLVLCQEPTVRMVKIIQWHDAGEAGPGDIPSPSKPCFGLGDVINKVERCVRENFGVNVEDVTEDEHRWLKCLDALEFYLFVQDQLNMGNQFVMGKAVKVQNFLDSMVGTGYFPKEVEDYYADIRANGRPIIDDDEILEMRE